MGSFKVSGTCEEEQRLKIKRGMIEREQDMLLRLQSRVKED